MRTSDCFCSAIPQNVVNCSTISAVGRHNNPDRSTAPSRNLAFARSGVSQVKLRMLDLI